MVELHIPRLGRVVATFGGFSTSNHRSTDFWSTFDKILITICVKKCCAVSPLTQAIAIINSELAEEDDRVHQGEGDTYGLGTGSINLNQVSTSTSI